MYFFDDGFYEEINFIFNYKGIMREGIYIMYIFYLDKIENNYC